MLTLVLGGARSGKSRYAESLIARLPQPWIYIATAEARDDEMAARVAAHRAHREAGWQTVGAPHAVPEALTQAPAEAAVLVDCLTLWLTNVMLGSFDVENRTEKLEDALRAREGQTVLVSNEVGLGIVPGSELGRRFRDAQGILNQRMAALSDRVVLMVAGLPVSVKETS